MVKVGRIAIVTGAAQGIGRHTAELLAERGYGLALNDLRSPAATLRAVAEFGAEAIEFPGDISDEAVVSRFAAGVRDRWGRADVLVNNAGISMIAPAESLSVALFSTITFCPRMSPIACACRRAEISTPPPGVNGTTSVMVRVGHSCAAAGARAARAKIRPVKVRRIGSPLRCV